MLDARDCASEDRRDQRAVTEAIDMTRFKSTMTPF